MSHHLHLRPNLCPEQRQIMTFALHQALRILQMPQIELAEWIQSEIERNPVLEPTERPCFSFAHPSIDPTIAAKPTLREHLQKQLRDTMTNHGDRLIAEWIIDELDDRGWFIASPEELPYDRETINRILMTIQTFDPAGIGARNLQESLWLQLRANSYSLAEILVRDHFDDLIQGRFAVIQKRLHISGSELQKALHRISRLSLHPASKFDHSTNHYIVPDLVIEEIDTGWRIEVDSHELPIIKIQSEYLDLIPQLNIKEERSQLRGWLTSAKWLQRCIKRRRDMLFSIGKLIIRRQSSFLTQTGQITSMDIQALAKILDVHPSTAWRAIANKTLACPQGLIPLRQFFSESASPVKEQIRRLIQTENQLNPMSDEQIMKKLQQMGIQCARRTVAKYRRSMHINTAARRKLILNKRP